MLVMTLQRVGLPVAILYPSKTAAVGLAHSSSAQEYKQANSVCGIHTGEERRHIRVGAGMSWQMQPAPVRYPHHLPTHSLSLPGL